jgi:hypothetical protein
MSKEKAAIFVDNSNIFKGRQAFSKWLYKRGRLKKGEYLRVRWDKLLADLERQDGGLDIYARHFFASLPPAADVSKLKQRPTDEEWIELIKRSAQSGFYKAIQDPPHNFILHGVPLRFADIYCRSRIKQAYYRCVQAQSGNIKCKLVVDTRECYECKHKFIFKYEKGVDVSLAVQLVLFGGLRGPGLDRIILAAGDGDYQEALKYVRREVGKDVQIVTWRGALSRELAKIANKPTLFLDDHWEVLCEKKTSPPLDEGPADLEPDSEEVDQEEEARE